MIGLVVLNLCLKLHYYLLNLVVDLIFQNIGGNSKIYIVMASYSSLTLRDKSFLQFCLIWAAVGIWLKWNQSVILIRNVQVRDLILANQMTVAIPSDHKYGNCEIKSSDLSSEKAS